MTSTARYTPKLLTGPQLRAIWAICNKKGLDPHDYTEGRSVKELSTREASALLDRLNNKPAGSKAPRRSRATRDVVRWVSEDQLTKIDKYRIAMGWTKQQLGQYMDARKYPSDPTRRMSLMCSSKDAGAVIEHLKKVVSRTLHYHAIRIGKRSKGAAEPSTKEIPQLLKSLPPTDAIKALFTDRCARWRTANPSGDWAAWADAEKLMNGRRTSCPATCAEMARLIERMEAELWPAAPTEADDGCEDNDTGVIAKIGGAT